MRGKPLRRATIQCSRFGKTPWVQPYSDQRIKQLAQQGIKNLDVICPGFAADCLETLEEITLRYGADFVEAGGTALRYIPALNAEPAHIEAPKEIILRIFRQSRGRTGGDATAERLVY